MIFAEFCIPALQLMDLQLDMLGSGSRSVAASKTKIICQVDPVKTLLSRDMFMFYIHVSSCVDDTHKMPSKTRSVHQKGMTFGAMTFYIL